MNVSNEVAVPSDALVIFGVAVDLGRSAGLEPETHVWRIQMVLVEFSAANSEKPDEGIWEIRGARHHFTHSKAMAWQLALLAALNKTVP